MKINWGIRIAILYISFVLLILTLVTKSMFQQLDLVVSDYYEQELKYNNMMDKIKNMKKLKNPISWIITDGQFKIYFTKELSSKSVSGTITFYRPSDSKEDKTFDIQLNDNNEQTININEFKKGVYILQIDWKHNQSAYYYEGIINILN
jgi:hypothetical protein